MISDPTVVLVDDDAMLRKLYRISLESVGHMQVVGEAADGETGLAAVRELRPDVVLLDLSMPTMDGLEALARMRDESLRSHVIVLTGFRRENLEDVAKKLGASAFLEKGIAPAKLVEAVRRVAAEPLDDSRQPLELESREALLQRVRELI